MKLAVAGIIHILTCLAKYTLADSKYRTGQLYLLQNIIL